MTKRSFMLKLKTNMIFSKEETKNLLSMLRSTDKENAVVAFEALKGVDTEKYLGELIVLYKYGKLSIKEWGTACNASSLIDDTKGMIIIPMTIPADNALKPDRLG